MATVVRFEDMLAWKKARELTRDIYQELKSCRDQGFKDQMQRASVSIVSNISEGFESGTRQEFLNYLYIAKASAGEVRAQLYIAHDIGYIEALKFKDLKSRAEEVSKLIASFIRGLKTSPHHGHQHKKELSPHERSTQEFVTNARKELSKIHPHIYNSDGSLKQNRP